MPLVPLVVVVAPQPGSLRPLFAMLRAMPEMATEWCPVGERRVLAYLVRHAAVLGRALDPTPEWDTEALFRPPEADLVDSRRMAGFPEPGDPAMDGLAEQPFWRTMLAANWSGYCERLPRTAAQRFYAEPGSQWLAEAMVLAKLPYRQLLLVRDPRSELAERWLAVGRTGVLPSGLTHVDTPLSYAERAARHAVRDRLRTLAAVRDSAEQICLRYEDLVERPAAAWARLRTWLQLPAMPLPAIPATGHEWPTARWRDCLQTDVDEHYRSFMGKELEALGYAV
ncbi:MAG: hypothetical protein JNL08_08395 [Planctomycetes bacterium]|nr:hypothetical protein [Planctomycetota bacterium]